ncbi:MAG: Elongation factor 4 [Candidatus Moranbacteria bacterium GW2011_GWF1_35_5]|nr:MAG: Elongation factor 4 [Candidatus Moranbacteria bacterium GW2011_GWF1_35_5]
MSVSQKNIRNFCIIAHIDHGKSTLSDRILELTGTVEKRKMKEQLLDQMDLERERGITIKLQPVKMNYEQAGEKYVLNLIDTPGHVDFGYEVSRSLAAVEGAVLLVDATKGVQAQTLSNLYLAIEQGLEIIPVLNKIDLPNANLEKTTKEIIHILGCKEEDIIHASGKTGEGVDKVLAAVIENVPSPVGDINKPLRALIFDSKYDTYKGVLADVRVIDGEVKREDKLLMMITDKESIAIEVGSFRPMLTIEDSLTAGDIGYIATGFKGVEHCRVGDTITLANTRNLKDKIEPLAGYKEVRPMVYASFYPLEGEDYTMMRDSLDKLKLNDASFVFEPESNPALGRGFRCGFLGMLHLEIIQARLEREFNLSPTITTPSVVYNIKLKDKYGIKKVYSPIDMPDPAMIESILEPYVKLDIVTPATYLGAVMELLNNVRSEYMNTEYIDAERVLLQYDAPLTDVIINFHDDLKSVSSGFASMSYEVDNYRASDLIKMDILVADEKVEAFSRIVPRKNAFRDGKLAVKKLKESIPRQNFAIAIQATIGGKVIARETISAFRKDVIAKLYGGDVTRKNKLLDKQKKGKKKMKNIGKVSIPPEAFLAVLKK